MKAPTDDILIGQILQFLDQAQAAHGQARAAFGQLYLAHADRLLRFIQNRVSKPEAAEELHQDVWLRVWDALPRQFHGDNFRAWLYQIARNICIDHARRRQTANVPYLDGQTLPDEWSRPAPGQVPAEQFWQEQRVRVLRACLQELERDDPLAAGVVRGITGGRLYVDLCQELHLELEQARRMFHDACKRLRKCAEKAQP